MKKKVVVVTDFKGELSEIMYANLREVFGSKIDIESFFLDNLQDEVIDGDAILFMLENRIERARENIGDINKVIVISRTILEHRAMEIMKIPRGSRVLVVNDYYETTLQFTSLLYKLKIKDLRFINYKDGEDYTGINYAVTCGIPKRVPKYIPEIIDVGVRVLDTATLVHIINKLEITDEDVQFRLLKYINKVVTIDEGMKKHYKEMQRRNERLKSIMEKSSEGIILVGNGEEILLYNDNSSEMLGVRGDMEEYKLSRIFPEVKNLLKSGKDIHEELVKHGDKIFLVSIKESSSYHGEQEKVLVMKDITYIKKLEQTISKKLKSAGLSAKYSFDKIIYNSKNMEECMNMAKMFATTDKTVLIWGESGTGKELMAQSIHNESKRSNQPFVAINCAALPESLLESELFGYEKGAFTGASKEGKVGLFEQANNGTIFLDEIGDMPYTLQSRLLRVLQERQVMRIGSDKVVDIDVRIIAATNKNLMKEVEEGEFREDLYYRINVLPLKVPSLRERKQDIIPLFMNFAEEDELSGSIINSLINHKWKGNVRELKNVAEYYTLMKKTENPLPNGIHMKEDEEGHDDMHINLLEIISRASELSGGIGRSALLNEYNSNHEKEKISEYRLRTQIEEMKRNGWIDKKIGRNGCVITQYGKDYLNSV